MDKQIEEQVRKIIAEILEVSVDEVTEDIAIGDIPSWDSLHHLQIIAKVESAFSIRFTPDVMMDIEDVGDIAKAVEERVK